MVDLPTPLPPTSASVVPRRATNDTASRTRRSALGGQRHRLAHDVTLRDRQRDRIRRLDHLDRRVEDLAHARPRHPRGGEAGVEPHQRLGRRKDAHLVGEEGAERAERQRAVDHAPAAVEERDRRSDRQQRARQPAGEIRHALHLHQRVDEARRSSRESARARGLARSRPRPAIIACSVSIRKLPMSALRWRSSATRLSSRRR